MRINVETFDSALDFRYYLNFCLGSKYLVSWATYPITRNENVELTHFRLQSGYKMQTENLKSFFVWCVITCHLPTHRASLNRFSALFWNIPGPFLDENPPRLYIISSLHIVFSLCAGVDRVKLNTMWPKTSINVLLLILEWFTFTTNVEIQKEGFNWLSTPISILIFPRYFPILIDLSYVYDVIPKNWT